ncbi:MAG: hypothetical protein KGL39_40870 [Patescibacteria group bacterium]|nr:hypothetical protein [Patescibacteria group bacterium]
MLIPYMRQIEEAAARLGVDLAEACRLEGISASTLYRWRQGIYEPRGATAEALVRRMEAMALRGRRSDSTAGSQPGS